MEKRTARNWYWWLWLSPLVTVPLCAFLVLAESGYDLVCGSPWDPGCDRDLAGRVNILIAVLGSSLAHLILFAPALNRKSEFVRWHGRQALLLAGLRTAVPLTFGLAFGEKGITLLFTPFLIAVWLFGTLLGQLQAARGGCSLARWAGRAGALPPPEPTPKPVQASEPSPATLVDVIRYSRDPRERLLALSELKKLGLVEAL